MANPEHVEILKQGVEVWNKWRLENPEVSPDLKRIVLPKADLIGVNLSMANLSEAFLNEANLSKANLTRANLDKAIMNYTNLSAANLMMSNLSLTYLSMCNLILANLKGANLSKALLNRSDMSGADLREATLKGSILSQSILIGANLSNADISGADINEANVSRWKIEGIKCTHINWKGKKLEFNEGEFERAFTTIDNTIEIILNLPFSEVGYHTGRIIQEAVNNKYGEGAVLFRGQTAISDTNTKFDFISFGTEEQFKEIKAKLDKIPGEIEKGVVKKLGDQKAEDDDRQLIRFKDEFDVPLTKGLVKLNTKELVRRLNERYMTMSPTLQNIFMAVQSAIQ